MSPQNLHLATTELPAYGKNLIVTEHGIMSYLVTFCDFLAATFTYDSHEIAIVQLMCTQNKFFIGQLVATF